MDHLEPSFSILRCREENRCDRLATHCRLPGADPVLDLSLVAASDDLPREERITQKSGLGPGTDRPILVRRLSAGARPHRRPWPVPHLEKRRPMIDDPIGFAAVYYSDEAETTEISDHDRRYLIAIAAALTLLFLAFSVYAGVDSGDFSGALAFAGLSSLSGGSVIAYFVLEDPAFRRGLSTKAAGWVLASNRRTWCLLGSLLVLPAVNVYQWQGWGAVVFTLPAVASFHSGVKWLRRRWGIEVRPRHSVRDLDEGQTDPALPPEGR